MDAYIVIRKNGDTFTSSVSFQRPIDDPSVIAVFDSGDDAVRFSDQITAEAERLLDLAGAISEGLDKVDCLFSGGGEYVACPADELGADATEGEIQDLLQVLMG